MPKPISQKTLDIIEALEEGLPVMDIATTFNTSQSNVRKIKSKYKVTKNKVTNNKVTKKKQIRLVELGSEETRCPKCNGIYFPESVLKKHMEECKYETGVGSEIQADNSNFSGFLTPVPQDDRAIVTNKPSVDILSEINFLIQKVKTQYQGNKMTKNVKKAIDTVEKWLYE